METVCKFYWVLTYKTETLRGPFANFLDSLVTPNRNFVEVLWRSLFEVPPLASDALITTLNPLLENLLQTVNNFEISYLGTLFSWSEKPRNYMGRDLNWILCLVWKKWIRRTPLEHPPYSSDLAPCDFSTLSNHENGAPKQEISKWSTVCSTFSRSGWRVVRNVSLAKGSTSKKWPSPHLHEVPTRSNKLSPRTLQTTFVHPRTVTPSTSVHRSSCFVGLKINTRTLCQLHRVSNRDPGMTNTKQEW
jgi:hypothetical protein